MVATVSLNPAIDKYLRIAQWRRGEHLEAQEVITSAGGKAVNVAGVLRALGEEVELIGFFGGFTGDYILMQAAAEGIRADPVRIGALTRTAFVIVEEDGNETEVVEPGGTVTAAEIAALRAKLREAATRAAVVVLSGSVPPGCPEDIYVQLLADCAGRCPVIVDTSRAHLRALLAAKPYPGPAMIKPNRRETEVALRQRLDGGPAFVRALRHFAQCGVTMPVISDGAAGLWVWRESQIWQARPPALGRVNSVGSGDATVAGFAAALARGYALEPMLRLAAACGAANVLTKECAQVHSQDVVRLEPQIAITAME